MRTREWDRDVAPRLMEMLPGSWRARDGYLSRVDADGHLAWHIARQVSRGGGYEFQAIIQPLYIVSEVMVSNVREDLGHGRPGTRSFFTEDTPDDVPVDEIGRLFQRFALPHFARYGTDLASFLKLTGGIARARPQRRGTWTTEAWTAGALTLLGDWRKAKRAWSNCLLELSQFDDDLAPELRKLAGQAVDANDRQERDAVVAWLEVNEDRMRETWHLG